ncbi:MAG: VWA domain-containing protein [Nibricoccus sp.]
MTAPDVKPTRLDRAKLLITSLLERLEGERVGLVVFAGTSFLQSPLSADYEILRDFLPSLDPGFLPQGGSNYRAMLHTSIDAFSESGAADRYLIVLSDGEATDDNWKPLADELKKKSIRVIGLGIGTPEGAMIPDGSGGFVKDERGAVVLSKLENATLQQLAEVTGGPYTDASSWVDLAQLINSTVEAGRKGAFLERNRVRLAERFQWALAPALLFLAWSYWREFPVRPRPRDIQLKSTTPPSLPLQVEATRTATLTALLCILSLFTLHSSLFAASAASDPSATIAAPLSSSSATSPPAPSFPPATAPESPIPPSPTANVSNPRSTPVPEGPIRDALLAVDHGEAADAKAANWPDLRAKLKKFLEKPEQPPQQDEQKKQDQKQDQKDKQDEKDSKSDSSDQNSKQEKSDSEQKQQPQNSKSEQSDKKDQQSQQQQQQKDASQNQQQQQSAFGDMKKQPEEKPPEPAPQPSEETQKIGGAPEKKEGAPVNLELTVPLQKTRTGPHARFTGPPLSGAVRILSCFLINLSNTN